MYLVDDYLAWIKWEVLDDDEYDIFNYQTLINKLFQIEFTYESLMDGNRAVDGLDLRYRFGKQKGLLETTIKANLAFLSCSVLDMMVALSIRTYEELTKDFPDPIPPSKIFWMMIENMHLIHQTDDSFDEKYVEQRVKIMLNHKFSRDGDGGLFRVKGIKRDMRSVEIWYQMQWWANSVFRTSKGLVDYSVNSQLSFEKKMESINSA